VPPQDLVVPKQGVGPTPSQRLCAPNEYVCYTTPALPGVEVGPYDLGDTPGVGGPVPVTVPGNDPVATPAQSVSTPPVPVDAVVTVGAKVWVGWSGGSVGPVSQAGLEVCAQGCPSPGTPSYGVQRTVVVPLP
ncbi:MAG TPA: hypothetical protein VNX21_01100, partial [Candidatus Thermoplasmatota archaeon]|nr:hypothetical protein [Candidatus Thermoplasmatota archaeon]